MLHSQPRQTCGHRFHDRCIVRWFQTGHHTCPLCRSVLSEDTLSDIEHDPTYTPAHGAAEAAQGGTEGGGLHGGAEGGGLHGGAAGASLHNPILIEDAVTVVPDTPVRQLPTPRRIVFEDQDHFNTIIHNAIDQRLRLLFP